MHLEIHVLESYGSCTCVGGIILGGGVLTVLQNSSYDCPGWCTKTSAVGSELGGRYLRVQGRYYMHPIPVCTDHG